MTYKVNRAQYSALEGLAHWCYQAARCEAERDSEGTEQARQTLATFPAQLDKLGIPYWVQNAVIMWAQDWRREASEYMDNAMARRNITRAAA